MNPELLAQTIAGIATHFDGRRFDSNETAMVARDLERVLNETYDVKYPEFRGRALVPLAGGVGPADEFITYNQWDAFGMAKVLANYADDLPRVDVLRKQFTSKILPLGDSFAYSIQDVRRSVALGGRGLDSERAKMARRAIEAAVDDLIAFGNVETGMPGLLNHPNVTVHTATNGDWDGASTTAADILEDLHEMVRINRVASKGLFTCDTVVFDIDTFERLAAFNLGLNLDQTVLKTFLATNPHIKNIDAWHRLDTADAAGTGPRVLCYARNSEVMGFYMPQEFEQLPPQPTGLEFTVPCHARSGGVVIRYPLGVIYMDGINAA